MKNILFSLIAILFAINLYAQPSTITYQGVLTDNLGAVVDGNVNIAFALYDQSANGALLWNETHNNVQVANGLFQVELNSIANNWGTANFASNMWLEITVGATTLTPRVKFNANGYSINAGNAITATSASTATTAATATNFSGNLTGDVTGTQGATVVSSVGGTTAANLASGATLANAATNSNTANAIVRRDPSGNFSAGTISANFVGNVTGSVIGNASTSTSTTNIAGGNTGSIPYQSGAGTTTMLAAGTNGHVLTLAGGVPSWAAPSGGGGGFVIKALVSLTNSYDPGVTQSQIIFDNEIVDVDNAFSGGNYIVPTNGLYMIQVHVNRTKASASIGIMELRVNGTVVVSSTTPIASSADATYSGADLSTILNLSAGSIVNVYIANNTAGTNVIGGVGSQISIIKVQ